MYGAHKTVYLLTVESGAFGINLDASNRHSGFSFEAVHRSQEAFHTTHLGMQLFLFSTPQTWMCVVTYLVCGQSVNFACISSNVDFTSQENVCRVNGSSKTIDDVLGLLKRFTDYYIFFIGIHQMYLTHVVLTKPLYCVRMLSQQS